MGVPLNFVKNKLSVNMCFFETTKPQNFSLPEPIINIILKSKENPLIYEKLIQTCKYFFTKNPVLVINYLYIHTCENKLSVQTHRHQRDVEFYGTGKLWCCEILGISETCSTRLSPFISRIYKCDLESLCLSKLSIAYNDYLKLLGDGSLSKLYLTYVNVLFQNGDIAPFEAVVDKLTDVKKLEM